MTSPSIAIVGAGPRGASLVERLGANLPPRPLPFDLHIIDPAPSGAGRIWRRDQHRELCMNTLAHAVTLFTEPESTVVGPIRPGPTLYEWCVLAQHAERPSARTAQLVDEMPPEHVRTFRGHPIRSGLVDDYGDELERLAPHSHPSRSLYGEYLSWCYERAVTRLPPEVRVVRHHSLAVEIERSGERELVTLADGTSVEADAVILATGWMPRGDSADERRLAARVAQRPHLTWVRQGSPADQDLAGIAPGADVIARGLGMGFFDTMALLTIGRGGVFVPDPEAAGGLRYRPSGAEPVLHATSRRGVPFRAKTLYGALPPSPEQRFLRAFDAGAREQPIDFDREIWPRVVADAFVDHATTLRRVRPASVTGTSAAIERAVAETLAAVLDEPAAGRPSEILDLPPARIAAAVAPFIPDPADRFDLLREMHPVPHDLEDRDAFDAWVRGRVADDLREAELGHDSPLKAGLWSISAARALAADIGTGGGFDAESRRNGFALLTMLGGLAGFGPPAFRNRQLLALAEAGLVRFIGPAASVDATDDGFVAESPRVPGSRVVAPALIDAWMHFHDLTETADELARGLLDAGRARPFRVASRAGEPVVTGAFEVDPETGRLRTADGGLDPAVHVAGIPVDEQLHGTIISPMPGTDPPMLRETDRIARSALAIVTAAAEAATTPEGALHA